MIFHEDFIWVFFVYLRYQKETSSMKNHIIQKWKKKIIVLGKIVSLPYSVSKYIKICFKTNKNVEILCIGEVRLKEFRRSN